MGGEMWGDGSAGREMFMDYRVKIYWHRKRDALQGDLKKSFVQRTEYTYSMDKRDSNYFHSPAWSVTPSAVYLCKKDKSASHGSGGAI